MLPIDFYDNYDDLNPDFDAGDSDDDGPNDVSDEDGPYDE